MSEWKKLPSLLGEEHHVLHCEHPDLRLMIVLGREDAAKRWEADASVTWSGAVSEERAEPPKEQVVEAVRRAFERALRTLLPVKEACGHGDDACAACHAKGCGGGSIETAADPRR